VSPSETDWPSSHLISLTVPSSSASSGISIFIDSRTRRVSPSSTSCPIWHSIFHTVPVMCASTSGKLALLDPLRGGTIPSGRARQVTNATPPGSNPHVKAQVYKDPRPAEQFAGFHERTRSRRPDWVYDLARIVLTPYVALFFRTRCIDSEHVPADGAAIIAPNHFSFLDHFFVAVYLRRKVHFMAKSQLFRRPLQWIFFHGGVFPVRRGHHDEEAFETAHAVLDRGDLVVMYAEAGRSRSQELGRPRHGLGRLALESGVPVVPTAIAGSERARNWKRLHFPKVTVHYGKPIRFERVEHPTKEEAQAASEVIFEEVRRLHTSLQRDGRRRVVRAARAARRAARSATAAHRPVVR
jgi:1-acyl-sn-glycerol-3-phosphate acyltransferase